METDRNPGLKRKDRNSPDQQSERRSSKRTIKRVEKYSKQLSSEEESDLDDRNRTPSGTVIPKISSIRNYFSPSSKDTVSTGKNNKVTHLKEGVKEISQARHCARGRSSETLHKVSGPEKRTSVIRRENINKKESKTITKKGEDSNSDQSFRDQTNNSIGDISLHSPSRETLLTIAAAIQSEDYHTFKKRIEMENQRDLNEDITSEHHVEQQSDEEHHPENTNSTSNNSSSEQTQNAEMADQDDKVITLSLVYQMFRELRKDVNNMRQESTSNIHTIKTECAQVAAAAASAAASDTVETECMVRLNQVTADLKHCQLRNEILADICSSMSTEIKDLTQKVENIELGTSKKMIVISGYRVTNSKKADVLDELERLFLDHLDLEVYVDDYFFLGLSTVVEFQSAADKRAVLQRKGRLRNVMNGKIYINEYTPIVTMEKRKREKQIIQKLDEVAQEQKIDIDIAYTQAGLTIQGTPYRKQITPPTPKDLVNLDVKELEHILHLKMVKGKQVVHENSKFQAFLADVTTHGQIRQYYTKLKLTRPTARHIVCAYVIPGPVHTSCDFHDDGEPGSGRILLQFLEERNLRDKVIFVVRKYGGVKIGSSRFACYRQAATSALNEELDSSSCSIETKMAPSTTNKSSRQTSTPRQSIPPHAHSATPNGINTHRFNQQTQDSPPLAAAQRSQHNNHKGNQYQPNRQYNTSRPKYQRNENHRSTTGSARGRRGRGSYRGGTGQLRSTMQPQGGRNRDPVQHHNRNRGSRYQQFMRDNMQETYDQFNFSNPINRLTPMDWSEQTPNI